MTQKKDWQGGGGGGGERKHSELWVSEKSKKAWSWNKVSWSFYHNLSLFWLLVHCCCGVVVVVVVFLGGGGVGGGVAEWYERMFWMSHYKNPHSFWPSVYFESCFRTPLAESTLLQNISSFLPFFFLFFFFVNQVYDHLCCWSSSLLFYGGLLFLFMLLSLSSSLTPCGPWCNCCFRYDNHWYF